MKYPTSYIDLFAIPFFIFRCVQANATEELRPAVERGDLTTVEECITNGANVNTFDSEIMVLSIHIF